MNKIWQRELEVAFSRHAQPLWFRIVKWIAFIAFFYWIWDSPYFWWIFIGLFVAALSLHFFIRYKTKGWTQSYGSWNYEFNKPKAPNNLTK